MPVEICEGVVFGTFAGDMVGPLKDFIRGVLDALLALIGDSFRTKTGDLLIAGNDFRDGAAIDSFTCVAGNSLVPDCDGDGLTAEAERACES